MLLLCVTCAALQHIYPGMDAERHHTWLTPPVGLCCYANAAQVINMTEYDPYGCEINGEILFVGCTVHCQHYEINGTGNTVLTYLNGLALRRSQHLSTLCVSSIY